MPLIILETGHGFKTNNSNISLRKEWSLFCQTNFPIPDKKTHETIINMQITILIIVFFENEGTHDNFVELIAMNMEKQMQITTGIPISGFRNPIAKIIKGTARNEYAVNTIILSKNSSLLIFSILSNSLPPK
ncbi:hypothetical protein AGMMS4952_13400 [Spirochaetia bacterium]|nr:hypothetical protein AGMMS4952_13400 [Spirochaetia bacterium]